MPALVKEYPCSLLPEAGAPMPHSLTHPAASNRLAGWQQMPSIKSQL